MGKKYLILLALIGWIFSISFCFSENNSGIITIAGSTSAQPLVEELSQVYMAKNPHIKIFVYGGGSGAGITAVMTNNADIGNVSRELKPEEAKLKSVIIARDGVVIIVNKANPVKNLTTEQLQKIYTSKFSNWSQVGGSNLRISVINREFGSGTRETFEELVLPNQENTAQCLIQTANGSILETVSIIKETIGYISYGSLDAKAVKALSVDGVICNKSNILSHQYKLQRPFIMVTRNEPSETIKDFLRWIIGPEGQKIVAKDYIAINN